MPKYRSMLRRFNLSLVSLFLPDADLTLLFQNKSLKSPPMSKFAVYESQGSQLLENMIHVNLASSSSTWHQNYNHLFTKYKK